MNILFISSLFPFPTDKGAKIRLLQLMRALRARHNVSLVSSSSPRSNADLKVLAAAEGMGFQRTELTQLERWFNCARGLTSPKPMQVWYCESKNLRERLRQIHRDNRFDFVIIHLLRMADYAREFEGSRLILDIGDAVSQYIRRSLEFRRALWERLLFGIECGRVERYERTCIPKFLCTLVCSEVDRAVLAGMCPDAKLALIPNAVDLEHLVPSSEQIAEPRIVFVGNFSYYPNSDAVMYFCREVLPIIWSKRPELRFFAVGASAPDAVKALAKDPRIIVTDVVPDIRSYLTRNSVAVCPVRFGGGTKFKVLEAMAMGLAVVCTDVGREGINVCEGKDLLVARNANDFAQKVLSLTDNTELRMRIGNAARKVMESNYDQRFVSGSFESLLVELEGIST